MGRLRAWAAILLGAGLLAGAVGAGEAGAAGAGAPSITRLSLGRPSLGPTGGSSSLFLDVTNGDTCWFTAPPAVQVNRSHRGCRGGRDWTVVRLGRASRQTTTRYRITGWVRARDGATIRQSVVLSQAGFVPLGVSLSSTLTVDEPYAEQVGATGGHAPYTMRVTGGALPPGISLASSGQLSGTPSSIGSFRATVTITDSTRPQPEQTTLAVVFEVVAQPMSVTTTALPNASEGAAYHATLAASGGTAPYRWSVASGTLPPGLVLAPSGVLSGTPTVPGTYTVTARATDSASPPRSATRQLTLVVGAANLQITTSSLPSATVGANYVQRLAATGGTTPYTWRVASGTLPPGLLLSSSGVLYGTPTSPGTYNVVVVASDSSQPSRSASQLLSITVTSGITPLSLASPANLPSATLGLSYTYTFTATGGTSPYTWHLVSGSPPPGTSFSTSGLLSGTPTGTGTYQFTVQVYDSAVPAHTATQTETLTVS